ncbi:HesB/YadR/YfhF family protein [Limosilactobacillus fastidiosus]|uniref:Fe-S cluster assembly protein HesB n=1 Tax=Limosilactobacillus fastidiosus TaxID=2759855 RepID=A0A7W3U0Q0_9LACO|nr:Fe-S cluster assembly protein HesB [Limosilactobacillus fastidiosus]MBB1063673.1 Fe-S cluster assembly protein HesB [Limosilactobacillus fastidiosus]MBB1086798.1 Fe-S cluster assembly protein HesB [Limosilactobacillus fastidiosus]MCD7084248.1 Fe-S cluster assembly protein HesB [Limosilactobacillus fastidiosus]MCD7085475.1 Fe-S cluster assembly protein HesB [Limosilactobacillus fastidiosus]MCD7114706.1 Fe-S cluster assembly protein HesB [Limosilactobacillus fastidiosus]
MKLIVTAAANKWFKNTYVLQAGDGIKFYGKTVQPHNVKHSSRQGFSPERDLGRATLIRKKDGINYHINFDDSWFFSGLVTLVDFHSGDEQPSFYFQREGSDLTINESDFSAENVDATTSASSKFEDYWE